jgi:hypothetical protein
MRRGDGIRDVVGEPPDALGHVVGCDAMHADGDIRHLRDRDDGDPRGAAGGGCRDLCRGPDRPEQADRARVEDYPP